jgi:glutamate-1-semialdehyde 2,1-aminomutase
MTTTGSDRHLALDPQPNAAPETARDEALDQALDQARAGYVAANPGSAAHFEAACADLPGGNTRSVLFYEPFPLRFARGADCRLWDVDGHEYVDFLGDFTAALLGHSDPAVAAAVRDALDAGVLLSGHNLAEARLAAALCARFPSIDLLRFTNSGTEANLMAIATAIATTGRREVLVFEGGYHGGVLNFHPGEDGPTNVPHQWVRGRYNDLDHTEAIFAAHGSALAAVLVEPMLGSGGCLPGDPDFLTLLRQRTEDCGALLILDEVMTSRLAPGGRQSQLGITADLTTLGKYLGGGLSFGAFGGRRNLMSRFDPRRPDALAHPGTFNNNVLSMSAGLAAHQALGDDRIVAVNARGDALRDRLNDVCAGAAMGFTGLGSLLNVHFTRQPVHTVDDVEAGDEAVGELFFFELLARGIYLARRGFIALSLPIGDAECDRLVAEVAAFVERHSQLLRP